MAGPVDLTLARQHLKVINTAEDDLIGAYLLAAQDVVEGMTGLVLEADDDRIERFSGFGGGLRLSAWPVREIVSVAYLDTNGTEQTIAGASWRLAGSRPARLMPVVGSLWPLALCGPATVTVTLKAGYATPAEVPGAVKAAMLLLLTNFYENRSAVIAGASGAMELPVGVAELLARYQMIGM